MQRNKKKHRSSSGMASWLTAACTTKLSGLESLELKDVLHMLAIKHRSPKPQLYLQLWKCCSTHPLRRSKDTD